MKKIGTMTFHHSYNYGSVLQAYALQNKLIEMYPDSRIPYCTGCNLYIQVKQP